MGQMMTKCPSKWPILWERSVRIGWNDDQMSLKEANFVKQNWLQWVKWWPNVLQSDQCYEVELFPKGQMMTKFLSKRTNLWDKIGCEGSNDDQMSFKETKFMRKKCSHRVKSWPNVLERGQLCEKELVAMGQMMTKCPSKSPSLWNGSVRKGQMMTKCLSKWTKLWDRIGWKGSNDDQMSFKVTNFMK